MMTSNETTEITQLVDTVKLLRLHQYEIERGELDLSPEARRGLTDIIQRDIKAIHARLRTIAFGLAFTAEGFKP